jgi:hypothetical protein
MTEFKYGNKKLSTADKTIEDNARRHPRLKKSYSECEYYENEGNFSVAPAKEASERVKQISINDITALQYNYDTLKSQYLLQQQQKLKEYKNDSNFLTNGDNYSSESSTETRGILKNSGKGSTAATVSESCNKNSLKWNKGLSTLSLCSCDAETEVTMSSICSNNLICLFIKYFARVINFKISDFYNFLCELGLLRNKIGLMRSRPTSNFSKQFHSIFEEKNSYKVRFFSKIN